jgi:hypothetical protein
MRQRIPNTPTPPFSALSTAASALPNAENKIIAPTPPHHDTATNKSSPESITALTERVAELEMILSVRISFHSSMLDLADNKHRKRNRVWNRRRESV